MTERELASSPFSCVQDADLFLGDARQREALATLRYGIESKKGLLLCLGAAGAGKSILIRRLARELDSGALLLAISDPHLSFREIIRALRRALHADAESEQPVEMLRECKALLRAHADAGRTVVVAFDDAHHMTDAVIAQALETFLPADSDHAATALAQVILLGRMELKERFSRAPLSSAAHRIGLEHRLAAPGDKEVGEYIAHRLRCAALPTDLFEGAATENIARCSGGNLRLVNALCERALSTVDRSLRTRIGVETIVSAAKDLGLWQPQWVRKDPPARNFVIPQENNEAFRFQFGGADTAETVGRTFLHLSAAGADRRWFRPGMGLSRGAKVLLAAALLAVPAVWLYGTAARDALSAWSVMVSELAGSRPPMTASTETSATAVREEAPPAAEPTWSAKDAPADDDEQDTVEVAPIEPEKPAPMPAPAPRAETEESEATQRSLALAKRKPRESARKAATDPARQISKAIENRAISGVRVTIKDNIAFLDGRVATERQRRAAENAAREAADVRGVRNRISVE